MPAAKGPLIESFGMTLPSSSRYISRCALPGAISRPSSMVSKPSSARCNNQKPPPPKPDPAGSTTARVAVAATAASKALPPRLSICCAASVASGWAVATPACCALALLNVAASINIKQIFLSLLNLVCCISIFRSLSHKKFVFCQKRFMAFDVIGVMRYALNRAYFDTLWSIKVADTFGAEFRFDDIDLGAFRDCTIRTLWFTDVTIDAFISNN